MAQAKRVHSTPRRTASKIKAKKRARKADLAIASAELKTVCEADWTHSRQNHCGVHVGIDHGHTFKVSVANYANYQAHNGQHQPNSDN